MDRFDAMRVFTRVVERRSFTLVAEDMNLPRSTVTDAVKQVEARLGVLAFFAGGSLPSGMVGIAPPRKRATLADLRKGADGKWRLSRDANLVMPEATA